MMIQNKKWIEFAKQEHCILGIIGEKRTGPIRIIRREKVIFPLKCTGTSGSWGQASPMFFRVNPGTNGKNPWGWPDHNGENSLQSGRSVWQFEHCRFSSTDCSIFFHGTHMA
jgi:hypothetical protein